MTVVDLAGVRVSDRRSRLAVAGRRQAVGVAAQLIGGVGNLIITVALARVLAPGEYATLVAFLAGYVLLHTVASSVTAAVALDPTLSQRLFVWAVAGGLVLGGVLAAAAPAVAPVLGLPTGIVVLLGISLPGAALMALVRGRLFSSQHDTGTAVTLCAEPLARGLLALLLVPVIGPTGACAAAVGAGYLALGVATLFARRTSVTSSRAVTRPGSAAVTLTFLLIAVIAAQDVILANRLLDPSQAGLVGAVVTLGGAAYFATATIPMVLLPSAHRASGSLAVALGTAAVVSTAAVVTVAAVPAAWFATALGPHYRAVDEYAAAYVAAMAALGTARVLLAQLCATGHGRLAAGLTGLAVLTQLGGLLSAESVSGVVWATGLASGQLLATTAAAVAVTGTARPTRRSTPPAGWSRVTSLWPLFLAIALGVALRMVVTRSIWVDEAISVQQAQLSFDHMMTTLRQDDVHPPLFAALLWALVHATGDTAEWVVRLPSLVAGVAFIPVLYAMARDLWDRRTARVAAFVAAVAPIAVWYAQEARMYAIWMLAATLAAWAQCRILRDGREHGRPAGSWRDWALFLVGSAVLVYLQWFALLPLLVQHAVFAGAALRRRSFALGRAWLVAAGVTVALFAPLIPFLGSQLDTVVNSPTASDTPGQTGVAASAVNNADPDVYAALANVIWALWGYHSDATMVQLGALWPLMLLACFACLGRERTPHVLVMALVALVPAVVLFGIGFDRRNFFELRYFTSTVPMLLLFVSRLAATWGRGPVTRLVLPAMLVASLGWGLADQQVNQSNPRTYDFRGAVAWVDARSGGEDVLVYAPQFLNHELAYYPAGIRTVPAAGFSVPVADPDLPRTGRSIFVFASFLDRPDVASQVGKTLADLRNRGHDEIVRHEVANVTVWEFQESR